jgi:glyoxylase-like metal-dependent hydrolase (beta-lactamase superfamily II)
VTGTHFAFSVAVNLVMVSMVTDTSKLQTPLSWFNLASDALCCAACGGLYGVGMSVEIRSFELPPIGTQCYVVINPGGGRVAVFDAPLNAFATVERLLVKTGYELDGLYLTHGHWDHTLDAHRFSRAGHRTYGHVGDRTLFEEPGCMSGYAIPGLRMEPVGVTDWLRDGERLTVAGVEVEVRHVPGHSAGSVLFWFPDQQLAISGDAIFRSSVGRTDFPGCSFEELEASIRGQIYTLPEATRLYPGHGPETTVGEERRGNPFVSG